MTRGHFQMNKVKKEIKRVEKFTNSYNYFKEIINKLYWMKKRLKLKCKSVIYFESQNKSTF